MKIEQFDYSTNLLAAVIWQYDEATNLLGLLNQKQTWYDTNQTLFWQNWYNQIFNLGAENTQITLFGLAVWSYILNIPLYVPVTPEEEGVIWGFNAYEVITQTGTLTDTSPDVSDLTAVLETLYVGQAISGTGVPANTYIETLTDDTDIVMTNNATTSGSETLTFSGWPDLENDNLNFNNAPFAPTQPVISLTIPQQQFLLLLKYFNCTTRGTISYPPAASVFVNSTENTVYFDNFIYNINQYLQYLCFYLGEAIGYGTDNTIYCLDNLNMTITYEFSDADAFPSNLLNAIQTLDLFPRPAGVLITT